MCVCVNVCMYARMCLEEGMCLVRGLGELTCGEMKGVIDNWDEWCSDGANLESNARYSSSNHSGLLIYSIRTSTSRIYFTRVDTLHRTVNEKSVTQVCRTTTCTPNALISVTCSNGIARTIKDIKLDKILHQWLLYMLEFKACNAYHLTFRNGR